MTSKSSFSKKYLCSDRGDTRVFRTTDVDRYNWQTNDSADKIEKHDNIPSSIKNERLFFPTIFYSRITRLLLFSDRPGKYIRKPWREPKIPATVVVVVVVAGEFSRALRPTTIRHPPPSPPPPPPPLRRTRISRRRVERARTNKGGGGGRTARRRGARVHLATASPTVRFGVGTGGRPRSFVGSGGGGGGGDGDGSVDDGGRGVRAHRRRDKRFPERNGGT